MKILVSGCSFTSGLKFELEKNDPKIWPNLLSTALNAEVVNVGVSGYDNSGIFLNAVSEFTATNYDLILIQITALNRVVVSPTFEGSYVITRYNSSSIFYNMDDEEYQKFYKSFTKLNNDFEHWKRLILIIKSLQNFINQGYNIKIINGLMEWDQSFFTTDDSNFAKNILDFHMLPDKLIQKGLDIINLDKKLINLNHWINPFDSMRKMQIDTVLKSDQHPGPKTHKLVADLILSKLNF